MDEKRTELYNYYAEERAWATDEGYKRHYRQLMQLMKEGRTVADGKTIRLNEGMLDMLHLQYTLAKQMRSERGRKGGSQSSEAKAEAARRNGAKGGRPRKTEE